MRAKRLYESIMSVGNSISPEEAFRRFRGRDVDSNALMRDRGFPVEVWIEPQRGGREPLVVITSRLGPGGLPLSRPDPAQAS